MELTVVPSVDALLSGALLEAILDAGVVESGSRRYDDAWRQASLLEGVDRDDPEVGYAPSPRSTRGATRA